MQSYAPNLAAAAELYQYQVAASDPEEGEMRFALLDSQENPVTGLSNGMAIDPRTGRMTWTPTLSQVGDHAVTLRVTDERGGYVLQRIEIAVYDPAINRPPVISSVPKSFVIVGTDEFVYTIDATDRPLDSRLLTYSLPQKPNGMTSPETSSAGRRPPVIKGNTEFCSP